MDRRQAPTAKQLRFPSTKLQKYRFLTVKWLLRDQCKWFFLEQSLFLPLWYTRSRSWTIIRAFSSSKVLHWQRWRRGTAVTIRHRAATRLWNNIATESTKSDALLRKTEHTFVQTRQWPKCISLFLSLARISKILQWRWTFSKRPDPRKYLFSFEIFLSLSFGASKRPGEAARATDETSRFIRRGKTERHSTERTHRPREL